MLFTNVHSNRVIHAMVMVLGLSASFAAVADDYTDFVRPILEAKCFSCHGPEMQKAGVRLDLVDGFAPQKAQMWTFAHEAIEFGEMPPPGETPLTQTEKRLVMDWIESQQQAEQTTGIRRLNRRELSAALQDITGLPIDHTDSLPQDGKVAGFDTGAAGLQDAADSVYEVMRVTRMAVDSIRFLEPAKSEPFVADLREPNEPKWAYGPWKDRDGYAKGTGVGQKGAGEWYLASYVRDRSRGAIRVPIADDGKGVMRIKLLVSRRDNYPGLPETALRVKVSNQAFELGLLGGTQERPETVEVFAQLDRLQQHRKGGMQVALQNLLEVPYSVKGFPNDDRRGHGVYRPKYDRKQIPRERWPIPIMVLHHIEIDPDYVAAWPPKAWGEELGPLSDNLASARKLLLLWMERAWRRPLAKGEEDRFLALYQAQRKKGLSFDDALRASFQAVLLSEPFRYLSVPRRSSADRTDQYALASRLAFMLGGAPPDRRLLEVARAGRLQDEAVLDEQVDRLLDRPGSMAFWEPFVTQWLEMNQPITLTEKSLKGFEIKWARHLRDSMRQETITYVAQLFRENRPARELIDSDWTMMNDALARHYGYEPVVGGAMRKFKLPESSPRGGGILGHAGIQSMLSWMGDNWVIYRGAWALRHILDDPPPPAPLEVPEIDPADTKGKTLREVLHMHMEDPNCAICHRDMDPLGFAFQNFDISGRWRDVEFDRYKREEIDGKIAWYGVGKTRPVDSVGRLPRGETFTTFEECKDLLAKHYMDDMVRGILKRFVLYGTGRQADVEDLSVIRGVLEKHRRNGLPLRDVLKSLVRSESFIR